MIKIAPHGLIIRNQSCYNNSNLNEGKIMAKMLTDIELGEIIHAAINNEGVIDCSDAYEYFLEDLGDLIANHFGGERSSVSHDPSDIERYGTGWMIGFRVNECVPSDGGIYKGYDTEWIDGKEA